MDDDLRKIYDIDRIIHEPARLVITALLFGAVEVDFLYLHRETGFTKGNLSSHLTKLEEADYIHVDKSFVGKKPRTTIRLTSEGREAFKGYQTQLERGLSAVES